MVERNVSWRYKKMRTKKEMINPDITTSPNDFLEVLIDIRDIHNGILFELPRISDKLNEIANNLWNKKLSQSDLSQSSTKHPTTEGHHVSYP